MIPHPEARLRAIATLAQALAEDWRAYENVEASLAVPTTAAAGGNGRSNTVSDPTFEIVKSHARYYETTGEIIEALGHLRFAQHTMARIVREHSRTAGTIEAAIRNARCDGQVDPTCVRNAVRKGMCWACYTALRRQENRSVAG